MKEIIDQAYAAIAKKRTICDDITFPKPILGSPPYYSSKEVEDKSRTSFLGINAEPEYDTHIEIWFNTGLFEYNLTEVDRTINYSLQYINNGLQNLKNELSILASQKDQNVKTIDKLKNQIISYQSQLEQLHGRINELNVKLVPLKKTDGELTHNINKTTDSINTLSHIKEITSNPISEVEYVIKTYTPQKRAFLLMKTWGKNDPDSVEIIDAIKVAGFDAHYVNNKGFGLVHLAADKNDIELLKLVIKQDPLSVQDKTVLQYAASKSSDQFLKIMLDNEVDFCHGMQSIIEQNNSILLTRLLDLNIGLLKYANLYEAINKGKLATTAVLIKKGANCDQALMVAIEQKDSLFLVKLFNLYPEAVSNSKIDKRILLKQALESGDEKIISLVTKEEIENIGNNLSNSHVFTFADSKDNEENISLVGVSALQDTNIQIADL